MNRPRILVVDDEETIRHILVNVLADHGCETRDAESAERGLDILEEFDPDVTLLDIILPGKNGLEMLKEIKQRSPQTEVVMMTSHASAETATRAIKQGAYTYLQKPFEDLEQIWTTVQRALAQGNLARKKGELLERHEQRSAELSSDIPNIEDRDQETNDTVSYQELIELFLDMVMNDLGVQGAAVLLLDKARGDLRVAATRGPTGIEVGGVRVPFGEGICGFVAKTGEPCVPGADSNVEVGRGGFTPHPAENLFAAPIELCIPLKSDGHVLGILATTLRHSKQPFGEGDISDIASLATRLAVSIEGTERADRLQKAYESLKETQDQLVRSERLKAIGQMAAGVAHDFNNVLSIIMARAEVLQRQIANGIRDDTRLRNDLSAIVKASSQGAETIRRIQNYTRTRKDEPRAAVDLNEVVRDAVEMTKPKWKGESAAQGLDIEVYQEFGEIPPVTGNVHELTQAVENLIFNAVDAMPAGGRVALKTTSDNSTVDLEVSDTGEGMDSRTQIRLFEPFFTTKADGQGLGTSIIYGIITRHKGRISVQSIPNVGTTFRITLPARAAESHPTGIGTQGSDLPFRAARVLLVDDDVAVRSAYEDALVSEGHQVVSASSSRDALAGFRKDAFDIVITDLGMGRMSGFELAREVKRIDPTVPVVLLTGWTVGQEDEQVHGSGIDSILIKPCSLPTLCQAVQSFMRKPIAA